MMARMEMDYDFEKLERKWLTFQAFVLISLRFCDIVVVIWFSL